MKVLKTVLYIILFLAVIACLTVGLIALDRSSGNGHGDMHIELSQRPTGDSDESGETPSTGDVSDECEHVYTTEHTSDLYMLDDIVMGWDPIGIGDLYTTASVLLAFDADIGQQQFYCLWAYRGDLSMHPDANVGKLFEKCYFLDAGGHVLAFVDSNKTDYFLAEYVEYAFKLSNDVRILGFTGLATILRDEPAKITYTIKSDICSLCGQKRSEV